jgi:hypothetical protein
MTCRVGSSPRSAWASTSATASLSVSATATHLQEQDTTHGAAMAATSIAGCGAYRGTTMYSHISTRRRREKLAELLEARGR